MRLIEHRPALTRIAALAAFWLATAAFAPAFAQQAQSAVTPADQIIVPVAPGAEGTAATPAPAGAAPAAAAPASAEPGVPSTDLALPSRGPDLEALRFYAKNGEHARYRREYQRIQTLYPGWIPPRDLFADASAQEQELWDLYGGDEIRALEKRMDEMRAADPGWQPSPALVQKIAQRKARGEISKYVEAKNWTGLLKAIDAQPDLINGDDIELLWFAGQAFAETGRKAESIEAFRAALTVSVNASLKAATLQKASVYLTAEDLEGFINELLTHVSEIDDVGVIEDGLIRGLLEASLRTKQQLPERFDDRLRMFMERAAANNAQADIELLAWSAFQVEDWEQAHRWFELMPEDDNQNPEVLEGKVLSLKHKGDWLTAFRKSQNWRNKSEDLGRIYINLGAPYMLPQRPEKFDPSFLKEYADKTLELKRGEGAEALGWYSYNIRQLRTAHEWFRQAVSWDETDTGAYGLVLVARAARDLDLFNEYKRIYGPVYPLIAETEFTPCGNDTPIETIYYESEEYRIWRERLEERYREEGRVEDRECLDSIEDRRVNEQRLVERLEGTQGRPIAPWEVERETQGRDPGQDRGVDRQTRTSSAPQRETRAPVQKVPAEEAPVRTASAAPSKPRATGGGGGSAALAKAQANGDFIGCLKISDQLIRSGRASAKDYETRGWCLMGANRPTEAEQSFAIARKASGASAAAYGETLANLRNGKTNDAHFNAANANLDPKKRRELDIEVLTQRARAAFSAKDYQSTLYALDERRKRTPETRDLMVMRGWALYHLGFRKEAHTLMKAVDRQLSTADSRRGVAVTGRLN